MSSPVRLLVVGGNGFLGSAVCRAALSRGWHVDCISTTGQPPRMPHGDLPAWTSKVEYHAGSAFDPASFSHLLSGASAVVHSMGILFESDYKSVLREGTPGGVAARLLGGRSALGGNPLKKRPTAGSQSGQAWSYESMNRDSALSVLQALLAAKTSAVSATDASKTSPRTPFVFVSAEDIFRPFVPSRYISTKREAERAIAELVATQPEGHQVVSDLIIRPGIMTHPTLRPILRPVTPLLALSASLPPVLPTLLRALSSGRGPSGVDGSSLDSLARALQTQAMDVDDVGEACCIGIETGAQGVLDVAAMRELVRGA